MPVQITSNPRTIDRPCNHERDDFLYQVWSTSSQRLAASILQSKTGQKNARLKAVDCMNKDYSYAKIPDRSDLLCTHLYGAMRDCVQYGRHESVPLRCWVLKIPRD